MQRTFSFAAPPGPVNVKRKIRRESSKSDERAVDATTAVAVNAVIIRNVRAVRIGACVLRRTAFDFWCVYWQHTREYNNGRIRRYARLKKSKRAYRRISIIAISRKYSAVVRPNTHVVFVSAVTYIYMCVCARARVYIFGKFTFL